MLAFRPGRPVRSGWPASLQWSLSRKLPQVARAHWRRLLRASRQNEQSEATAQIEELAALVGTREGYRSRLQPKRFRSLSGNQASTATRSLAGPTLNDAITALDQNCETSSQRNLFLTNLQSTVTRRSFIALSDANEQPVFNSRAS